MLDRIFDVFSRIATAVAVTLWVCWWVCLGGMVLYGLLTAFHVKDAVLLVMAVAGTAFGVLISFVLDHWFALIVIWFTIWAVFRVMALLRAIDASAKVLVVQGDITTTLLIEILNGATPPAKQRSFAQIMRDIGYPNEAK